MSVAQNDWMRTAALVVFSTSSGFVGGNQKDETLFRRFFLGFLTKNTDPYV